MKIFRIIKIAFKNIISNKLRSILTMLGLIIGIASVIILVGVSNGSASEIKNNVQSLGTDILTINVNSQDEAFKYEDMMEISELANITNVAPYKNISATVNRGNTTSNNARIMATDENYLDIRNLKINNGRTISIIDIENKSKVCIIGSSVKETLFNLADPIGQNIKLNGDNYIVIGVLEEAGTSMGTDFDNTVIIPISTAKYLGSDSTIKNLYVKIKSEDLVDICKSTLENYVMSKLQITSDYYSVSSQSQMLEAMDNINNTFTILLGGIASISLVVGGIGVMNVMLVSVTERIKEIGIRKSLGARKIDILFQFLVEALVLSLLGGILGVVLGLTLGKLSYILGYNFEYSSFIVILAFCSSAAIGIIFGIFPAYRAAQMNPIDALRQE